ncbi:MAG: ATP-binding protein, partial [Burkholderiaceae bacterium]|nr:ATP-binding protein [Burkholderiaceae bacterium]
PNDDERFIIQYIEPVAFNREAVGLDIGSETHRRRAVLQALHTGKATLTAPITLVQASSKPGISYLLLLPVYAPGHLAIDPSPRETSALGLTYAPLVIQEVLDSLNLRRNLFGMRVADVEADASRSFYETQTPADSADVSYTAQIDQSIAGRTWRITLNTLPGFVATQGLADPRVTGIVGLVLTGLLAAALYALQRARSSARELRTEQKRRAVALQTSRDAIVLVDPQGTIVDWNQGAIEMFGYAANEVLGQSALTILVPPEFVNQARQTQQRAQEGMVTDAFDTQRLHRDGQRIDVSVLAVPLLGEDGKFSDMALSMRDIRAKKASEREIHALNASLEQSEKLLDRAGQVAKVGGWELDARTRALTWTAQTRRIHEVPDNYQPQLDQVLAFYPPEARSVLQQAIGDVISDRRSGFDLELPLTTAQGRGIDVRTVGTVDLHDGEVVRLYGALQDITERKAFERKLAETTARAESANQAKSEFLANMSHEIRSPLNAIAGLTYLLRQTAVDSEQATFLNRIKLASDTLLQTINDVLDLAKVEAGEMTLVLEPFALERTISDTVDIMGVLAHNKDLPIALSMAKPLPKRVLGDCARLTQVLTNLLSNAIKFTERGKVTVEASWEPTQTGQGTAQIHVRDSGIGLDSEALKRIFEPFVQADGTTTRRFGGTGLGLAIVKQLVERMGGQFGVSSKPGEGSDFWVEIPFELADDNVLPSAQEFVLRSDALAGKTILIVDDSDVNRDVARRIIERKGAQVLLAEDGTKAVGLVRYATPPVDLVLMDLHMPVMDGFEATRRIRLELNRSDLPILALSAGVTLGERQSAREAGMNDFVTKPFDPGHLLRTIVQHLGLQGSLEASSSQQEMDQLAASAAGWPKIAGVDMAEVRERLSHDRVLFTQMLQRLFRAYPRLALRADLADAPARRSAIDDVHKLKGNAGTLGMKGLYNLAATLETHLRQNKLGEVPAQVQTINDELTRLNTACAAFLAEQAPRDLPGAQTEASAPLSVEAFDELIRLLRERNMRAVLTFDKLAPTLRARMSPETFQATQNSVQNLQFAEALRLIATDRPS